MKKLSLLLASVTLATVSAFAQTKPAAPKYATVSDFTQDAAGKSYYLYNVEAGVFLTKGNNWGTRASVASNGKTDSGNENTLEDLKLGKAEVSGIAWTIGEGETTSVGGKDVLCYTFANPSGGYNTADDWNDDGECVGIWVDGADTRPYNKWVVSDIKNNTFKLTYLVGTTENDVTTWTMPAYYYGVQKLAEGDTRTYIMEGANTTWALVAEADYTPAATALNLYYVQLGLSELIEKGNKQTAGKYDSYKSLVDGKDRDDIIKAINEISPLILLGEALAAAKAEDASRNWSAFQKVYDEAKADADSLNKVTDKVNALIALHKSIAQLTGHDNSKLEDVYKNDDATVAQINDTKAIADAYIALKDALDKAKAEHPTLDFTEPQKVYEKNDATKEELDEAKAKVQLIIDTDAANDATAKNPVDYTHYIQNATFDKIGDFTGWSGTAFAAGGTTSTNAEHFNKNYDTYQDLNGGQPIPNGIYKLGVTAFYRAGSIANDWNTKDDPSVRNAKLYGTSGDITKTTDLPALSSWATQNYQVGATTGDGTYYVPNTMADFTSFKEAGFGSSTDLFIPVTNAKLRVGVKKSVQLGDDWTIVDDFTLTYYGDGVDAYQLMLESIIEATDAKVPADGIYTKSLKAQYDDIKAKAKASTNKEEILALSDEIAKKADELVANIAAWKAYMAKKAEVEEKAQPIFASKEGEYVERLEAYLEENAAPDDEFPNGTYKYIIAQLALSTEQLTAETEFLTKLLDDAVKKGLAPGDDCTDMIVNAAFSNGFTGWTNSAGNVGDFSALTPKIPNNVEVYDNIVNCYQVVKDVPDGIYSLSVKAFERPGGNGSYDGSEPSKVSLFMNDFQTPVQNIVADAMPEDEAQDGVNCYITRGYTSGAGSDLLDYLVDGHGYVPNGMVGAAVAFGAGRYEQTVYGLVEGGEMKIGLTSNDVRIHWVLWADFKLTYEGKSFDALESIIKTTGDRALAYLDNNSEYMTVPAYEAIMTAYALAIAATDDKDTDAMWDALVALNKALNDAPANIAALEEFKAAYGELDDASLLYLDDAPESTQAAYEKVIEDCGYGDEAYLDFTTEQLKALTEEMKRVTALLLLPSGYEDADDDNPFDMTSAIFNPGFEDGTEGWTLEKTGIQNAGIKGSGLYGQSAEFWNPSVGSDYWFNISQKLRALPAGTYELVATAFNAQVDNAEAEGYAALYAITTGGNASSTKLQFTTETPVENSAGGEGSLAKSASTISLFFKVEEGEGVTIGFQSIGEMPAHWFICDNWELWYYGTDSKNEPTEDEGLVDIDGVEVESPAIEAIYTVTGAKVSSLQKGINIVKYTNGKVAKVLVK